MSEELIKRLRIRAKQYMTAQLYDQASILTEAADALESRAPVAAQGEAAGFTTIRPTDPVEVTRAQANAYFATMKILNLEPHQYLPDEIRRMQSAYASAVRGRADLRSALRAERNAPAVAGVPEGWRVKHETWGSGWITVTAPDGDEVSVRMPSEGGINAAAATILHKLASAMLAAAPAAMAAGESECFTHGAQVDVVPKAMYDQLMSNYVALSEQRQPAPAVSAERVVESSEYKKAFHEGILAALGVIASHGAETLANDLLNTVGGLTGILPYADEFDRESLMGLGFDVRAAIAKQEKGV